MPGTRIPQDHQCASADELPFADDYSALAEAKQKSRRSPSRRRWKRPTIGECFSSWLPVIELELFLQIKFVSASVIGGRMAVGKVQLLVLPGSASISHDLYTGLQLPGPLQNISSNRAVNVGRFTLDIPAKLTSKCELCSPRLQGDNT